MMQRLTLLLAHVLLAILATSTAASAQTDGPATIRGTVHLRGGDTLTGRILAVQFDAAGRQGIGEMFEHGGCLRLRREGGEVAVSAPEISAINVDWQNLGTDDAPDWQIASLTLTKKAGEKVTGKPTWPRHVSYVKMQVEDAEKSVVAFPAAPAFDPNKLAVKIVLQPEGGGPEAETAVATGRSAKPRPGDPTPARPLTPVPAAGKRRPVEPTPVPRKRTGQAAGPPMWGTVEFRDGRSLTGAILAAEFGVADKDGIGQMFEGGGSIKLAVDREETEVAAGEISQVAADWQDLGDEDRVNWQIVAITITKRDGEQVTGKPTWFMHASYVRMQVEGQLERAAAFPLGRNFDPDKLAARIVLHAEGEEPPPPPQ